MNFGWVTNNICMEIRFYGSFEQRSAVSRLSAASAWEPRRAIAKITRKTALNWMFQ